jgi:F-type H+-transporting ATPase subunit a
VAEAHHEGPLAQFKIARFVDIDLGGFDASFTNSAAMMVATTVIISALMIFGLGRGRLVPGRMQALVESAYEMVARMLGDTVGGKGAERAFPLVFSLFMFLLFGNVLGLIPFAFTFTSHIIVTVAFALVVFVAVTILAIIIHKHKFLSFFLPPGVPMWMAPLLVPIEVVSYLARPISLAVRLFANMMAGHTILHVFGAFVISLGLFSERLLDFSAISVLPFGFILALYGLELLVACLQAYVFAILTCLYIRDAIHLHH